MELIYTGKTKDVYRQGDGNYLLNFKDRWTGETAYLETGFQHGGNDHLRGWSGDLRLTKHFFVVLQAQGIPTHYIDDRC
jgi:phosphoribosylaminoimidazole-succinocarboxamide synthase